MENKDYWEFNGINYFLPILDGKNYVGGISYRNTSCPYINEETAVVIKSKNSIEIKYFILAGNFKKYFNISTTVVEALNVFLKNINSKSMYSDAESEADDIIASESV